MPRDRLRMKISLETFIWTSTTAMSRSFLTALHDAYTRVTEIEPLSPTASPGTASAYQRTLAKVNQYTGQMSAHIRGVAAVTPATLDEGTGEWGKRFLYPQFENYANVLRRFGPCRTR
jgi:hypothetical protein